MTAIRISAPDHAKAGDIMELKALIRHDMESGYRRNDKGGIIPRNILTQFTCHIGDKLVFKADMHPGVSANPLLIFHMRADKSGTLTFEWTEQTGQTFSKTHALEVV